MLKKSLFTLFLISTLFVFGQTKTLAEYEKELNTLSLDIINNDSDESKFKANQEFKDLLLNAIETQGSFEYEFKGIQAISILTDNETIKIYNWTLPKKDLTYEYFAFIQVKLGKDKFKIVELTDKSATLDKAEHRTLNNKTWYGALYHKIIIDKKLGKNTYTLLGWNGGTNLTNQKIIEIMTVSNGGTVRFGSSILKVGKKSQKRVVFHYSESAVMSLKYNPTVKAIVFDFLAPPNSNLNGVFEYYGPSLDRVDSFQIENGKWEFIPNYDAKLNRNLKDDLWNDPKK
jgi:hypothetical protein